MNRKSRRLVLVAALMVSLAVVAFEGYVVYRWVTFEEQPVPLGEVIGSGEHEGKKVFVEGYVVKVRSNGSVSYKLQTSEMLRRQAIEEGLIMEGGSFDAHSAYVYSNGYRTIHTATTAVRGRANGNVIEVSEAEIRNG